MTLDALSLCRQAQAARVQAYAPFSQFLVGAAIQTRDGRVFVGGNVENPSYGLTICAERAAICAAAAAGVRPGDIAAVAVCADATKVSPCGACRQVLAHFCDANVPVYGLAAGATQHSTHTVGALLPGAFDLRPSGAL